ncbi:MAG: hypothetical protein ACLUQ6_09365 [Alistipes onderdonkii]
MTDTTRSYAHCLRRIDAADRYSMTPAAVACVLLGLSDVVRSTIFYLHTGTIRCYA